MLSLQSKSRDLRILKVGFSECEKAVIASCDEVLEFSRCEIANQEHSI